MSTLTSARYGKDLVRVFRTVRDPQTGLHTVAEYNIQAMVEGQIETRCGGIKSEASHTYLKLDNHSQLHTSR
jgi:hypothetical protein